jgi:hypothetical protein
VQPVDQRIDVGAGEDQILGVAGTEKAAGVRVEEDPVDCERRPTGGRG